jgi:hypothetical protein
MRCVIAASTALRAAQLVSHPSTTTATRAGSRRPSHGQAYGSLPATVHRSTTSTIPFTGQPIVPTTPWTKKSMVSAST